MSDVDTQEIPQEEVAQEEVAAEGEYEESAFAAWSRSKAHTFILLPLFLPLSPSSETSAPAAKGAMSIEDALQDVLKKALVHDGLARGLRESVKCLDRKEAHLCVLVESCTEASYLQLVEALCNEHKIGEFSTLPGRWSHP